MANVLENIHFNSDGLVPAIIQDIHSREVLMLAYMNREAIKLTLETQRTWFFSRSRNALWNKGETSGHFQHVREMHYDCDGDTLLVKVVQTENACHTGKHSCFFNEIYNDPDKQIESLHDLVRVIEDRKNNPQEGSYTNYLLHEGKDKILKKIGEEASEVIIGAKNNNKDEVIYETADLTYHILVLLAQMGIGVEDILAELSRR